MCERWAGLGVRVSQMVWPLRMTKPCTLFLLLMDDLTVDDEKKPFDEVGAQNDEDSQPDPDEHLMLESGHGRVWLVKVC